MTNLWGSPYSRLDLLRRVGDMRQLGTAEPFELVDGRQRGVRGVRLYNAAGLDLTVLPDRGMAITHLSWKGTSLPMFNGSDAAHPAFTEHSALGWLRTWPAGFLTTCGLTQVGSPDRDGEEDLGQHGRVAGIPAEQVSWGAAWQGEDYLIWVEGLVREGVPFGHNLALRRRIWTRLDEPRFWIEDRVTNLGFEPAPHMFLQHFNLGFPLVSAATRLELPAGECTPRDPDAVAGVADWHTFADPTPGYHEQVFYHDLQPDSQGLVHARLVNPHFQDGQGLSITWTYAKAEYPILVEWKMMGEGLYVVGVEPANCHVEGRVRERERGTLQILAPQEERSYRLEIALGH
jgi:hypothetical protein